MSSPATVPSTAQVDEPDSTLQEPKPDASGCFIPTLNGTGFMTTRLDAFSAAFVMYAAIVKGWVLEIGAAYGIATLAALMAGAKIICNDIDERHLKIVEQKAIDQVAQQQKLNPVHPAGELKLAAGEFPEGIDFPENSLEAVLICRVLHFFEGERIEESLRKVYRWLKPGGKVFIVVETPWLGIMKDFLPQYYENVKKGDPWPGVIRNFRSKFNDPRIPNFIHSLDETVLTRVLQNTGFGIERISYINRSEDFPPDRYTNGKESIGAIGVKPRNLVATQQSSLSTPIRSRL